MRSGLVVVAEDLPFRLIPPTISVLLVVSLRVPQRNTRALVAVADS
jgi:hypothetical protein